MDKNTSDMLCKGFVFVDPICFNEEGAQNLPEKRKAYYFQITHLKKTFLANGDHFGPFGSRPRACTSKKFAILRRAGFCNKIWLSRAACRARFTRLFFPGGKRTIDKVTPERHRTRDMAEIFSLQPIQMLPQVFICGYHTTQAHTYYS